MKKTVSISLIVCLCLVLFVTQVFAAGPAGASPKPKKTPGPNETPEVEMEQQESQAQGQGQAKANHPGRKYNFKGDVTSFDNGVLVIAGKHGGTVTVDANTEIKVSGADQSATIQVGQQVMAQAVKADNGYLALRVHLFPNKPAHIHRVGQVTAYQPGVSITVQDNKGSTTFQIAPDVKILPAERADQLKEGARVTIISPSNASADPTHPVAKGIVVHPAKAEK